MICFVITFTSKNAQFNVCLCCVPETIYSMSNIFYWYPVIKKKLILMVRACLIPGTVFGFIDRFQAIHGQPTNSSCKWISEVHADTPTATISITTTTLHTHKPSASQLKKLTDRPRSILPDQIYNLSAGKHAGGLKVEEPSIWSRYNSHCSVCSTWAHFTLQQTGESIWAPL